MKLMNLGYTFAARYIYSKMSDQFRAASGLIIIITCAVNDDVTYSNAGLPNLCITNA